MITWKVRSMTSFLIALLAVCSTFSAAPNTGDLVVSGNNSRTSEARASDLGQDAFRYEPIRSKDEFDGNSGKAREANKSNFEKFITNDENAGLLLPFLMKFDTGSLKSLKAGIYDDQGYKRSMAQAGGTDKVLKKADESLWREHKKAFEERRNAIQEMIDKHENVKGSISGGESNPDYKKVDELIKNYKKQLDEEEKRMRASFRLNLKSIEKELNFNWFGWRNDDRKQFLRFNSGLLNSKDGDVGGAAKVEFENHRKAKSQNSIFRELNNRVDYVVELATAAGENDSDARKWAMVYILSWQFTKQNIDSAIRLKEDASGGSAVVPSDQDQEASNPDSESSDNGANNGDGIVVDVSKWNNEQRSRYNRFIDSVKDRTDFTFMAKKFSGKEIIGAYSGVTKAYKQGMPTLQDNLEKIFLPKALEYKNNSKLKADTSAKANRIRDLIRQLEKQMEELEEEKTKLEIKRVKLQEYINRYDSSVKVEDLAEKSKLVSFLQTSVQKGASVDEAKNLSQQITYYTQQILNVVDRTVTAFETWKALHQNYKQWDEDNSAGRLRIVEWIKNFDKRRVPISDLHNYGRVAADLVSYVKSKHAERFDSLNIPFSSQITTSCLSLLKGVSLDDLKISKSENPTSLNVSVDSLEKQAEKRLFCYAHYEWIMKEQAASNDAIKLFDDGRDTPSLAISMAAIYEFMGPDRGTVKTPEKYDFSIYEGMGDFLKFVDNFRALFIKYLKAEFAKRGKVIEELSKNSGRSRVTVQTTEHDSVSFRFPAEVLFDTLKAVVKPEGQKALKDNLPILLDILGNSDVAPLISKLTIEGHADSRTATGYVGKSGQRRPGNDGLSDDRAEAVYNYWNSTGATQVNAKSFLSFSSDASIRVERWGYGAERLIKNESGVEDMDRSRRVEIKFSLNLEALAAIKNDWIKLQRWNTIFKGDLSQGTGGAEIPESGGAETSGNDESNSDLENTEIKDPVTGAGIEEEDNSESEVIPGTGNEATSQESSQSNSDSNSQPDSSASSSSELDQSEAVAGYPAAYNASKKKLAEYSSAVEKSGQSPKVGDNDLFKVEGEGLLAPFSSDQVYRNVKLNDSMIEWLKDNKDRVRNHDAYFGSNHSPKFNEIYDLYVDQKGAAKARPLKRESTWRGPALDQDKLYTLPLSTDMKSLQAIFDKMEEDYNSDKSGEGFAKWKASSNEDLTAIADSAKLLGYPANDQTLLYNYEKMSRKISLKDDVAKKLVQIRLGAMHYDKAHRPEKPLTPRLETIYKELVDDQGKPKILYHSKPPKPRGGHALRGWNMNWSKRTVVTPQDLESKIKELATIIKDAAF